MARRLRLGNVFGVELSADWSLVFLVVLAMWTLLTVGARLLPTLDGSALTLLSALAALGLFASLAIHEVAHGLAARACGVPVRRLTMFLFGGITDVERAPSSPRTEIVAAIVAPLTSAVLGMLLLVLLRVLGGVPSYEATVRGGVTPSDILLVGLAWLASVNLALAAFNLLPAFPLDGGRVVRALLWRRTGDVERATRLAALSGQVLGGATVVAGVAGAFAMRGLAVPAGMWVAFAGWFLASAAAQAYQAVRVQTALDGLRVSRVMRRRFRAVPAAVSVSTAVRGWLGRSEDGALAVVDGERFVGLVTMDRVNALPADAWDQTAVSAIVARGTGEVASPDDDLSATFTRLVERDDARVPVVDGSRLVGVVERADIERWIQTHAGVPSTPALGA